MKKSSAQIVTVSLENFPAYQPEEAQQGKAEPVSRYLEMLAKSRISRKGQSVEMPSISVLAGFFKCTYLEVYDAFRALRNRGYDFQFSSMDGAMTVWLQPGLVSRKEQSR